MKIDQKTELHYHGRHKTTKMYVVETNIKQNDKITNRVNIFARLPIEQQNR